MKTNLQPNQKRFKKKEYKKRIADKLWEYRLEEVGAILIEEPKWCGKTITAEQKAKSVLYMADPDNQSNYLEISYFKNHLSDRNYTNKGRKQCLYT